VEVEQQYADQVTFVGVPGLADEDSMAEFIAERGIGGFANVRDADAIWELFEVTQQRTYVLLNDDGTWEQTGYGSLPQDVQELISR